jgi:O-antigen/teichoic acid export membrane protein
VTASASLARNAFHLVVGQVSTMILGVLFSAVLGRNLGARDFGLYYLLSSFSAFALVVVDWGQQYFGIREVARSPARGGDLLGTGLVLRGVGTALICAPVALSAWAFGYDRRTVIFAVVFVALSMPLFLAQNFGIVFRGHDRMGLDATVSVTNRAVGLVLVLVALWLGLGLPGVVATQGLAGMAALLVATQLYRRVSDKPLRYSRVTAREILAGGTAIVTMTVAVSVQPYIDAVLLSKLVPKEAVGWYGAARQIMGTLLAPSLILGAAAFPRLSRAAGDVQAFREELIAAQRPMVWLGGLVAVGTWFFADSAIGLVYGKHFAPAGIILSVFGLGLFLVFIDVLLSSALVALGRATAFSILKIATVILATGLELILIPFFQQRAGNGGLGVVTAFVGCEILIFTGMLLLMPKGAVGPTILVDCGRAFGSAMLSAAVVWLLRSMTPWVAIPVCIAVYTLASMGLGLLRKSDLQTVTRALGRAPTPPVPAPSVEPGGASSS